MTDHTSHDTARTAELEAELARAKATILAQYERIRELENVELYEISLTLEANPFTPNPLDGTITIEHQETNP